MGLAQREVLRYSRNGQIMHQVSSDRYYLIHLADLIDLPDHKSMLSPGMVPLYRCTTEAEGSQVSWSRGWEMVGLCAHAGLLLLATTPSLYQHLFFPIPS